MTEEQAMAERRIYEITGADREHFLQGLVSNDVRRAAPERPVRPTRWT